MSKKNRAKDRQQPIYSNERQNRSERSIKEGSGTVLSPAQQATLYNPTETEMKAARRRDRQRVR